MVDSAVDSVDSAVDSVDSAALQLAGVTRSAALERWWEGARKGGTGDETGSCF